MTSKLYGWNIRNVRYEQLHEVRPQDFASFVHNLSLRNGMTVLDMMGGYGAITREVQAYAQKNGIRVHSVLSDASPEQLHRSYTELGDTSIERRIEDARACVLPTHSVDRVAIKMGLHEVPQRDQQTVINHVARVLKPHGIACLWEVILETEEQQLVFQDVLREKDRLAGFDTLVRDRYFCREDEVHGYLARAGFSSIDVVRRIPYRLDTEKRCGPEFNGNHNTLERWNDYIRERVPECMRTALKYEDTGATIGMTFPKGIIRAVKN